MNLNLHSTGASFVAGPSPHNPRSVIVDLMRSSPTASRDELFDAFRQAIDGDVDYQRAVDWYFFINMHSYLTGTRGRSSTAQKNASHEAIKNEARALARTVIEVVLLDLTMPNGKAMRDCTGAEMARFGNRYQRIAERVGKSKLVGSVLNEEQVRKIFS